MTTRRRSHIAAACAFAVLLAVTGREAHAQSRDSLLNGVVIGAAVGAGAGIAFTHAVRDSDLVLSQYARGALIFGAIGTGIGLGVDALLDRASPAAATAAKRVLIRPRVGRNVTSITVQWCW
jgi:hypothetical protein